MSQNYPRNGTAPPIPTYDEAITSRPHSSRSFQGPSEISDDAERQGLLPGLSQEAAGAQGRRRYEPAQEDHRRSEDSLDFLTPHAEADEDQELRRDMEQMEVSEAGEPSHLSSRSHRRLLPRLSKRITAITESLSTIRIPPIRLSYLRTVPIPHIESWKTWHLLIFRICVALFLMLLVYGLFAMRILTWRVNPPGQQFVPESIRSFIQGSVDPENIRRYLYEVTFDDHVAGTKGDFFLAEWVHDRFVDAGLEAVHYDDYEVYLNYPKVDGRRVAIVSPPELVWQALLEEDTVEEKKDQHQVPVFHGHSKSGNVTGPLIYANYGAREDFAYLKSQGIDLNGAIALVKYGGTQGDRALKVKAAELAGAAGCIIYSDPKDDGFLVGDPWPSGPYRPSDGVQRGAVSLMSWSVGDVLTPGWASTPEADRVSLEEAQGLVKIPSLPLAWRDAQVLLQSLANKGVQVPENWKGGVPEVDLWWTGDATSSPQVNLMNIQDENIKQPIRNVIGRIGGVEDPQKVIYVGNHRDAWCFGSVDPGSGTAVMLEVVRIFGELVAQGWRPRRSIVFASWDAEEYNLIGSTEFVENSIESMRADAVAYLNVDVAASGQTFRASGNPVFENLLLQILRRVEDPDMPGASIFDAWNASSSKLEGLGAGSDYVAFQDLAGCASLDMGFSGPSPYHSCYETFGWMDKIGDAGFVHHAALAEIWGLLILELADEPLLLFDMAAYAREVSRYVSDLKADVAAASVSAFEHIQTSQDFSSESRQTASDVTPHPTLNLTLLEQASDLFLATSAEFLSYADNWVNQVSLRGMIETHELGVYRMSHNARASNFDTHLLDLPPPEDGREGGVPGRNQFKHVIYGPQKWSGYDEAFFPAVRDMIDEGEWEEAQKQVEIVAGVLGHAAWKLVNN